MKHGVHVNAVNRRDIYVVRKRSEAREQTIQIVLDPGANAFGVVGFQHHGFGIAGAKETAVRQFSETVLDRQAADGTARQFDAVGTDEFFFAGDFVGHDIDRALNWLAANRADILRPRRERTAEADARQQKKQKKKFRGTLHGLILF